MRYNNSKISCQHDESSGHFKDSCVIMSQMELFRFLFCICVGISTLVIFGFVVDANAL